MQALAKRKLKMDRKCKIEETCDLESETQSSPLKEIAQTHIRFQAKNDLRSKN